MIKSDNYAKEVLCRIKVDPDSTVLDIGCGPGILAIPLAKRVKSVTALDMSEEMLRRVKENAKQEKLDNIIPMNRRWSDVVVDQDIKHDIVVSSRSLDLISISEVHTGDRICLTWDLKETPSKMDWAAKKCVYITFIVSNSYDAAEEKIYKSLGRKYYPGPSYIYVYNMLYQMGICANVEFWDRRGKCSSQDETVDDWKWKLNIEDVEEGIALKKHLSNYLDERDKTSLNKNPCKVVLIWWEKGEVNE